MYLDDVKGIIVTDKVYCLDKSKETIAEELSRNLCMELEHIGYQFDKDFLVLKSTKIEVKGLNIGIHFTNQNLQIIKDGNIYIEDLEHYYEYSKEFSVRAVMQTILLYTPYQWLTLNDLKSILLFVNNILDGKFSNKLFIAITGYYTLDKGSIDISSKGEVFVQTCYGREKLYSQFSAIACGWAAMNVIVEGVYRFRTVCKNNNIKEIGA